MTEQPESARENAHGGDGAWSLLLGLFGADRETAAVEYERVRARLCDFFRFKGMADPEALSDETLDRIGRKLAGGEVLRESDPARYALGVARFVYLETVKAESRQRRSLADQPQADEPAAAAERERRFAALEHCLGTLAVADRSLVLRYHQGGGTARIAGRKALAAELGVTVNSLRIRAHRCRERLEGCVRAQLP